MTDFQTWFRTYIEEKKIDLSEPVKGCDGSTLYIGDVCSNIMGFDSSVQKIVKDKLILIDVKCGMGSQTETIKFLKYIGAKMDMSHRILL